MTALWQQLHKLLLLLLLVRWQGFPLFLQLRVPEQVHLHPLFLPPYSPKLQPAEHL